MGSRILLSLVILYCKLLSGCFDTSVYLFPSEYVRRCTQWVSKLGLSAAVTVICLHGVGRNDFTYGKQDNVSKYIIFRTA